MTAEQTTIFGAGRTLVDGPTCETCDRPISFHDFDGREVNRRHCSAACRWQRVERVIAGDTRMHSKGYVLTYLPFHPASHNGWVYEHRLVMERKLGRFLASREHVHHVNEDKADNRPENLALTNGSEHQVAHRSGIPDEQIAAMLRAGATHNAIVALGVSGHRVCRVRRELRAERRAA